MLVIPATQEAEMEGSWFEVGLGKSEILTEQKGGAGCKCGSNGEALACFMVI
jgi:hypothetical protein